MPTREDAIVLTHLFLREPQEDDGALLGDGRDYQDGENDDEDRAERQAELALVPPNVLARLLEEESELLPACHLKRTSLFFGVGVGVAKLFTRLFTTAKRC